MQRRRLRRLPDDGGNLSITNYSVDSYYNRHNTDRVLFTKMILSPLTREPLQLRLHAAMTGHPIAGDIRFGAHTDPIGRLALHSSLIVMKHPRTRGRIRVEAPLPDRFEKFVK